MKKNTNISLVFPSRWKFKVRKLGILVAIMFLMDLASAQDVGEYHNSGSPIFDTWTVSGPSGFSASGVGGEQCVLTNGIGTYNVIGTGNWLVTAYTGYESSLGAVGQHGDGLFIISETTPPSVPLSDWAVYIGVFLIGGIIVIRFRKRLTV